MRHNNSKSAKQARCEQAKARNAAWNELTPREQLTVLLNRPGSALRQIARIQKMMKVTE